MQVRQSAGLLLKNNLKDSYAGTSDDLRRYIKVSNTALDEGPGAQCHFRWTPVLTWAQVALLHAINNPSKPLRQTVGTSVAVIVGVGGLQNWPELLGTFTACLDSGDKNSLEGALDALYKVSAAETCTCAASM